MPKTATTIAAETENLVEYGSVDLSQFGVDLDDYGSAYPSIQANMRQPQTIRDEVRLCLSEDSLERVDESVANDLAALTEASIAVFDKKGTETAVFLFNDDVRFVVLGRPRVFLLDTDENEVIENTKQNWKDHEGNVKTTTRVPVLVLKPDGTLLLDEGSEPQIFTLRLTGMKTQLVTGGIKGFKTLADLQTGLAKHYKTKQSLIHCVSVKLVAVPQLFESKTKQGEESLSVFFTLDGAAKPLPQDVLVTVSAMLQREDVVQLVKDPFGIEGSESAPKATEESGEVFDGAVPF